jgi:hypothetical protein
MSAPLRLRPEPHAAQLEALGVWETVRHLALICGRRWGKSFFALVAALRVMVARPGAEVIFLSPVFAQARSRFRDFLKLARRNLRHGMIVAASKSELRVELANGSAIVFASAFDADRIRGDGYDVAILDEVGFLAPSVLHEVVRPALADRQGRILAIGTPKGRGQLAHTLFELGQAGDAEWRSLRFATASNPRIPMAEIEAARRELPADVFGQEYEATFLESSAGVFRGVRACVDGELAEVAPRRRLAWGWDLAKSADFTVGVGIDPVGRRVVAFHRWTGVSWAETQDRIIELVTRNPGPTLVDATGLGAVVVDHLKEALGDHRRESFRAPRARVRPVRRTGGLHHSLRIEGVILTNERKADLVQALQLAIERRRIKLPRLPVLIAELETFGYEMLPSGRVSYSAPSGLHDDAVIALALANFACSPELIEEADPVLRQLAEIRRTRILGPAIHPLCGPPPDAQHLSNVIDAALLKRKADVGLISREEYLDLRRHELPVGSWPEVWAALGSRNPISTEERT